MFHPYQNYSNIFPKPIIVNVVVLLLGGDRVNGEPVRHDLILSHNFYWSRNKNSKHSKTAVHFHGKFHGGYCCHHL